MKMEDDLKRYYREIKKNLTCSKKSQKSFLAEAHRLVADFLENQPDGTYADVVKNIGEPNELADAFLKTLPDETEIQKYYKKRRRLKHLIIALSLLLIVALCGIIIYIVQVRYATTVSEGTITIISQKSDASSVASTFPQN